MDVEDGSNLEEALGFARFLDSPDEGRLQVKFSKSVPFWGAFDILETDYKNYAVIFSRTLDLFGNKVEYAWVLSRKPLKESDQRLEKIKVRAKEILEEDVPGFKFDKKMRFTNQSQNIKRLGLP